MALISMFGTAVGNKPFIYIKNPNKQHLKGYFLHAGDTSNGLKSTTSNYAEHLFKYATENEMVKGNKIAGHIASGQAIIYLARDIKLTEEQEQLSEAEIIEQGLRDSIFITELPNSGVLIDNDGNQLTEDNIGWNIGLVIDDSDNNTISYLSNQDYYGTDTFKYKMCRPRDMVSSEEWEDTYIDKPAPYCGDEEHFHVWIANNGSEINELCSNGYEDIDYDVSIDEVVLGKYDKKDIKMLMSIEEEDIIVYVLSKNVDVDEFIKNNNLMRRV